MLHSAGRQRLGKVSPQAEARGALADGPSWDREHGRQGTSLRRRHVLGNPAVGILQVRPSGAGQPAQHATGRHEEGCLCRADVPHILDRLVNGSANI